VGPRDTELPYPGRNLQQKREAREAKDQQALDKLISKVRGCLPLYEPEQAGICLHMQQLTC
jgi:hypothetical protein